jgi:hypothetical protein
MPPKIRDETTDLADQLAAMKAALESPQCELERAHNSAKEERPEGVDAFIAAVSKVEIPSFWEADPASGSGNVSQHSAAPTPPPPASSSTTSWGSCPTQYPSHVDRCYLASTSRTKMHMRDSKRTYARTSEKQNGS